MRDHRHQPGTLGSHCLNSSWPGILLEFQDFLESSARNAGKKPWSRSISCHAGRLISNIPGFLVVDEDASLTFLTVHLITKLSYSSSYNWKFFRKQPCFNFMCRKPKTIHYHPRRTLDSGSAGPSGTAVVCLIVYL
jgi:hypothetical protein